MTKTKIIYKQFKKISLSRIFADFFTMNLVPDLTSCRTWVIVDRLNNGEVDLMIRIDPSQKKANQVVGTDFNSSGINEKFLYHLPLLQSVCLIPRAKSLTY